MKIVEIIVLMGTQCVSPIQHAPMMTEVSKVPCAVVIEKDTVTSQMEVSPPAAVNHPTVSKAMVRLSAQTGNAVAAAPAAPQPFRIEPAAAARRAAIASPIMPPLPPGAGKPLQEPLSPPAAMAPEAETIPPPEQQVASLVEEPQDAAAAPEPPETAAAPPAKPEAKAKPAKRKKAGPSRTAGLSDRCKGTATAKWYKNKQGHMKYRCVSGSRSAKPKKAAGTPAKALY